ncbi:BamA/TamA family outer membrane protein [Scytonema sp. NUACC21]
MRLSPVIVTVVAIAAPLGSSLSGNAQTVKSSNTEQTAEVTTSAKDLGHVVVGVFPASPRSVAKPEVIVPTSITSKTAQNLQQAPVPENQPPSTQQQLPSTPGTSTPEDTNQPSEEPAQNNQQTPLLENQPSGTQQTPSPETQQQTPSPETQQQTPSPDTQQQTPSPDTQQQNPSPDTQQTPSPETQQQTPSQPSGNTTPENTAPPTFDSAPPQNQQETPSDQAPAAAEPRVLVSEVLIRSEAGQPIATELEDQIYRAIRTQPGRTTTRSQLQEDINAVFATGFFSNVQAVPEDTPLGVRVSFVVQPNPVLTKVQLQANPGTGVASVLPADTVETIFKEQYGRILNLRDLQEGIKQLTKRYQEQGYALANVIGAPQVSENGVVTLQVAEGVVEDIRVQFRNKEGQTTNEKGEQIRGRTQPYIVTRELQLKPGTVFNRNTVQRDLQRVFGLGLFEDVNVSLDPGTDPSKVDVVVNVVERNSGSIAAGAGISSASGLFGTISYQQQNLNGRNQKLGAEVQLGIRELLFDLRFTDPWIAGDPYRTSYTTNIFRRRSISLIFEGDDEDIETVSNPLNPNEDGDTPRVIRLGGGVNFTRPLSRNPFERSEWTASAGLQYQRVTIRDSDGDTRSVGRLEGTNEFVELSESGEGRDDLLLVQLGLARDLRNNPLQPTSGSFLRFGVDQSVPIGLGTILLTRLRGSYSQYLPVNFTNFTKGPETLAFNVQAGTILGDLPPYEAFTLGGSNSVRGYEEGGLGSGRSFVQASVEYRFPVFSVVSGALFFDVGSDLGTSTRSAELLNKNGSGYGFGIGVRVQSPLGPIRIDYGVNDDGDSRINFGIGERF